MPTVARSRPLALPRRGMVLVAAIVVLTGSGCRDDGSTRSPSTPAKNGLVVLAGTAAAEGLFTWDAAGNRTNLSLPDSGTAWLSASRRGALMATLADGTLRASDRLPVPSGESLEWRRVPSPDAELPPEPLYFANWAPNGLVVAAIATDRADRRSLVIVDPIGNATLILPLDPAPVPLPPAWLDVDRVAVPDGDGVTIVDSAAGEMDDGPDGVAQLAASADGTRVAIVRLDGTVEVRPTAEWLAGSGDAEVEIPPGDGRAGTLALDRRGDRLAVVWERSGEAGLVVLYRRDGVAWTEAQRFDLPDGRTRGVPGWLP